MPAGVGTPARTPTPRRGWRRRWWWWTGARPPREWSANLRPVRDIRIGQPGGALPWPLGLAPKRGRMLRVLGSAPSRGLGSGHHAASRSPLSYAPTSTPSRTGGASRRVLCSSRWSSGTLTWRRGGEVSPSTGALACTARSARSSPRSSRLPDSAGLSDPNPAPPLLPGLRRGQFSEIFSPHRRGHVPISAARRSAVA
jgi:hypothetical protein